MPGRNRSAEKRTRQAEKRSLRNSMWKSRIKTTVRKFMSTVTAGDLETARKALSSAFCIIDKAVSKGVVHWRTADRKKSKLARYLSNASRKSA